MFDVPKSDIDELLLKNLITTSEYEVFIKMCKHDIEKFNQQTNFIYSAASQTQSTKLEANTTHFSNLFIKLIFNVCSIAKEIDTTKHNNIYEIMILTMHSLLSFDSGFRLHREFCSQLKLQNYTSFFDKLNDFFITINNNKLDAHK